MPSSISSKLAFYIPRPLSDYSCPVNYVWGKMQMNCVTLHGVKQASDFSPTRFQFLVDAVKYAMDLVNVGLDNFKPPVINCM